jgi:hypothetical protein
MLKMINGSGRTMSQHEIVPQTLILTKQTYAAPMSYVGSTRRIPVWASKPARLPLRSPCGRPPYPASCSPLR